MRRRPLGNKSAQRAAPRSPPDRHLQHASTRPAVSAAGARAGARGRGRGCRSLSPLVALTIKVDHRSVATLAENELKEKIGETEEEDLERLVKGSERLRNRREHHLPTRPPRTARKAQHREWRGVQRWRCEHEQQRCTAGGAACATACAAGSARQRLTMKPNSRKSTVTTWFSDVSGLRSP